MNRKNKKLLTAISASTDWLLIVCVYIACAWLWLGVWKQTPNNMAFVRVLHSDTGLAACIYAFVLVLSLSQLKLYSFSANIKKKQAAFRIAISNLIGSSIIGFVLYFFRLQEFSRGVLFLFIGASTLTLTLKHILSHHLIAHLGFFRKNVLLLGGGDTALAYAKAANDDQNLSITLLGYLNETKCEKMCIPYLGALQSLKDYLQDDSVDEVVIAFEAGETGWIRPMLSICEQCGARVSVIPFYSDLFPASPQIETIGPIRAINLRGNQMDNLAFAVIKRSFDILVSAVALLLLSPLFLVVAIGVKHSSPGPIFFRQKRVGLNKKLFTMYKFRSMRLNDTQDTAWSTDADPRKTRFGSILRKYSIDELPQLFNVLRGDMSLVGPRPEIPYYVDKFQKSVHLYMVKHQVRPGITGWAQINGYRGDTDIQMRIDHDIWYIEHMSVSLDLRILWRTFFSGWVNDETYLNPAQNTQQTDQKASSDPKPPFSQGQS
ncbi:MAG: undecaprenyl-phosphate glucose phosphotransferase [Eubacteriales bacterium]|nr:undecaprenyl-phosphate glucose phosphotransferase [Eubacteriales bacterium]